jgi:nitric oxide reductase NorQ protein
MSDTFYLPQKNEVSLFEHAANHRLPVLLKGPTGCGKTRFVYHMAEQLKLPVYTVACHDDLSAADLVGRHLIGAEGTYWQDGPLTRAVREGGICYLDEIVEARKDTTVVLHPLTDHRRVLPIDKTGELLEAHPDFMLVISYNPGYQNVMKGLKPSTRQRFVAMTFDYPQADIEQEIVVRETEVDPAVATQLVTLAHAMRRLTDFELEEAASTRLLIYAGLLINSGLPVKEACVHAMIEPLTDDNETQQALLKLVDLHFE